MHAHTPTSRATQSTQSSQPSPSTQPSPYLITDGDPGTLRSLELFAGLPGAEVEELAARGGVSTAHPGQVVQAQGVPVRMWHVITAGHAVVQRDGTPIGLLGRGDSWSEHSILNGLPSSIAVVALSPCSLSANAPSSGFPITIRSWPDAWWRGRPFRRTAWHSRCSMPCSTWPIPSAPEGPARASTIDLVRPPDAGRWPRRTPPRRSP
jgi:hypothetical protein